tara:strand:+ start:5560 stop:6402 length:843 start_codon:yes stop_codon:yes gene_type:complete
MIYLEGEHVNPKKKSLKDEGFAVYRQSNLKNYYTCPHMFNLAQTLPEESVSQLIESKNTKMGLLFEGYVFGFKTPEEDIKGIGTAVKDRLKNAAEYVNNYPLNKIIQFGADTPLGEFWKGGKSYYDQMVIGETLAISGEADFFHEEFGFIDLKHTEEISKAGWTGEMKKYERMQCIVYPFMKYIGTGKIHPFYYVIVETKHSVPVIRVMKYTPTKQDFEWIKKEINLIHSDPFFHPFQDEYGNNCLKQSYGATRARCKFLQHCVHGRELLGGFHEIKFSD